MRQSKGRPRLWGYVKSYRFRGLFMRYLALCLALGVLPLLACATVIRAVYTDALTSEVGAAYQASIERMRGALDSVMAGLRDMTLQLAGGENIRQLIFRAENMNLTYADLQRADEIIGSMSISESMYPFITSIALYTERNHYLYTSHDSAWDVNFYFDTSWLPEYERLPRNGELHYALRSAIAAQSLPPSPRITVYRVLPIYGQRKLGALMIDLDPALLRQYLLGMDEENLDVSLLDTADRLLFSAGRQAPGIEYAAYDAAAADVPLTDGTSRLVATPDGDFQYSVAVSAVTGWKLVFRVPAGQYMQKVDRLSESFTMILSAAVVLSVLLSLTISARVYAPFQYIHSTLGGAPPVAGHGTDNRELDFILDNITHTQERNRELHGTLEDYMQQLKRAQNEAMQAQINPHFLYNTLDAINWLAKGLTGGENEASRMTGVLSRILRYALKTGSALVPLRDEVEHVRAYVQIQQARLGDGIQVAFDVPAEAMGCTVVKLTLQPLVENAIVHGLKPKGASGRIEVSARREADMLVLRVGDDGAGIPPERLAEVRHAMEAAYAGRDAHIGLSNVHLRLRLLFGDAYGLDIRPGENGGTCVCMRVPWIVDREEGNVHAVADDRR